jgi:hypothetical protein
MNARERFETILNNWAVNAASFLVSPYLLDEELMAFREKQQQQQQQQQEEATSSPIRRRRLRRRRLHRPDAATAEPSAGTDSS